MSSKKTEATTGEPVRVKYLTPFPITGREFTHDGYTYRLVTKEDCLTFRNLADSLDGFTLQYNRLNDVVVWDKKIHGEATNIVKVFGVFPDVDPLTMYDMLQDSIFREVWDNSRIDAFRIVKMDENNDIGYYAAKSPVPMVSNRDFVNQRAWINAGDGEYVIFNTTVPHKTVPNDYLKQKKISSDSVVRSVSKITGYLIRPWISDDGKSGASLTYITQCDLGGWIPSSVMNYITTKFAPNTIKTVRSACVQFAEWIPKQTDYVRDWPETVEPYGVPVQNLTIEFVKQKWADEKDKKDKKKDKSKKNGDA